MSKGKSVGGGRSASTSLGIASDARRVSDPLGINPANIGKPLTRSQNNLLARIRYLKSRGEEVPWDSFHKSTLRALKRKYYIDHSGDVVFKYPQPSTRPKAGPQARVPHVKTTQTSGLTQVDFASIMRKISHGK